MKLKIGLGVLVIGAGTFLAVHYSKKGYSDQPTDVANVDALIVPSTFQRNQDITVFLSGKLDRPCQRIRNVVVERSRKKITIKPIIDNPESEECINGSTEYEQPIKLANVPMVETEIKVIRANGAPIEKTMDRNAERVYKPFLKTDVNLAVPESIDEGQPLNISMNGFFPNGCFEQDYAEAYVVDDIIMVYPNSLQNVKSQFCTMALVPYKVELKVPNLKAGRYIVWQMDEDQHYKQEKVIYVNNHDLTRR